jgi:hypothetical protein
MRRRRDPLLQAMSQDQSTEAKEFVDSGIFPIAAYVAEQPRLVADEVTLVVYGWHNVDPGPLSWVFPSLTAALNAARAMRNAVKWVVVRGQEMANLADARESGDVLAESAA